MVKKILQLNFIPLRVDLAVLILRVWVGFGLFAKHGIEKFTNFSQMQDHFPDPIGVGSTFGLTYALVSDGFCSILIMLGLATRLASIIVVFNFLVVFTFMHGFSFGEEHAELVYVYLGSFLALVFAGSGRYSLDQKLLTK